MNYEKLTLSYKEAQAYTGMSRKVLQKYVNSGVLKFLNTSSGLVFNRYRFSKIALEDLVEKLQHTI